MIESLELYIIMSIMDYGYGDTLDSRVVTEDDKVVFFADHDKALSYIDVLPKPVEYEKYKVVSLEMRIS